MHALPVTPYYMPFFESELQKIASYKLRAAEAAIGGTLGAGAGFIAGRDKNPDYSDEARAAGAGALIGAGGGAGLSAVIRALRASSMVKRELPAAIEAGKAALAGPENASKSAKEAFDEVVKGTRRRLSSPRPTPPGAQEVARLEGLIAARDEAARALDDAIAEARRAFVDEAPARRQSLKAAQRESLKIGDTVFPPIVEQRMREFTGASSAAARAANDLAAARGAFDDASRWDSARGRVDQAEAALKASKDALEAARKTHGEQAVRTSTANKAHDTYAKKLFGLIG